MLSDYDLEHFEDTLNATHFTGHLLRLIMKADISNREKLRKVFPEVVAAYQIWLDGGKPTRETINDVMKINAWTTEAQS